MQVTEHVYNMHIDDGADSHPGGSNNFFVGDASQEMVMIDTGDHHREWTQKIIDYYRELGSPKITDILITHGHPDHTGGLDRVYDEMQAPVRCHPKLVKKLENIVAKGRVVPLKSREVIKAGGATLRALFTPGHEIDHVCFYLKEDLVMFTGDTILGASSTSVRDLSSYMKSLELLTRFKHETVCPAHGPVVPPPKGRRLVQLYKEHRELREKQVLDALSKGVTNVEQITREVYPKNLKKGLRRAAEGNVATHLEKLVKEGRVEMVPARYGVKA